MTHGSLQESPAYAVIMAGGSGTRFWPYSRKNTPKHLLKIFGEKTLLQKTVGRLLPLFSPERILVVTADKQLREVKRQLPELPEANIIAEPVGRNTAPCIGLAALHIHRREPGAIMVALPADQMITEEADFCHTVAAAILAAAENPCLITIGIRPTAAETGYGYIHLGDMIQKIQGKQVFAVRAFREKPSAELARRYLAQGDHLWNSGIFIWRVATIREEIRKYLPELHELIEQIPPDLARGKGRSGLKALYTKMPSISIDYGVLEKSEKVLVLPGEFSWRDLGSWEAFWDFSPKDREGNLVQAKEAIIEESQNTLALSPGKLVVLIGVHDLLVVETKDTLLICPRSKSQEVGQIPKKLARDGKTKYL